MSTRDELDLIENLVDGAEVSCYQDEGRVTNTAEVAERILDALIAEGWRKKPSREEIIDALVGDDTPPPNLSEEAMSAYLNMRAMLRKWQAESADAILALMDRGQ